MASHEPIKLLQHFENDQGINNMFLEQIIVLAVIQGITEFLPISSSGHLILVPALTGWKDQGLIVDVMVHMGSFLAVITYFWRDVLALAIGGLNLLRGRMTDHGRLGLYIVLATIPAVAFGLFVKKTGVIDAVRGPEIVAWNAIIFGLLMYFADRFGKHVKAMENMTFMPALVHWPGAGGGDHPRNQPLRHNNDCCAVFGIQPA